MAWHDSPMRSISRGQRTGAHNHPPLQSLALSIFFNSLTITLLMSLSTWTQPSPPAAAASLIAQSHALPARLRSTVQLPDHCTPLKNSNCINSTRAPNAHPKYPNPTRIVPQSQFLCITQGLKKDLHCTMIKKLYSTCCAAQRPTACLTGHDASPPPRS